MELNDIFDRSKNKYAGLFGVNWINFAMSEVRSRLGIEFYQSEPRKRREDPISPLLTKVDPMDGGFSYK